MFLLEVTATTVCNNIPDKIFEMVGMIVTLIKIAVPVILIIFGMLDLGKAVMAQKEDEIKKGQQTFIKRLIAAAVVFLVVVISQLVIKLVATGTDAEAWTCADALISGKKGGSVSSDR